MNFSEIKLLVLDVDGVLTDGTIVINADGSESKCFNTLDGHGIRMWQRAGLDVALLSGRASQATQIRADQLGIKNVFQDCHDKLPVLQELLKKLELSPKEVAYIGDDLPDLPLIRFVGFGIAVANATESVKQAADYITIRAGGNGAVREVIEYILTDTGQWQKLMNRYEKKP